MFLGGRIRSEKVLACAAKGAASLSPQSGTNQESGTDELFHCVKLDHAAGMEWFAGDLHAVFTGAAIPFRLTDVAKLMSTLLLPRRTNAALHYMAGIYAGVQAPAPGFSISIASTKTPSSRSLRLSPTSIGSALTRPATSVRSR
jgi:hypothetical protein